MAAESMVVTGQYVAGHSALPSTQPVTLPTCSSVSTINTTCSDRDALELVTLLAIWPHFLGAILHGTMTDAKARLDAAVTFREVKKRR